MPAAGGPVDWGLSATEVAIIFAVFGLVPPFLIAVFGWGVHAIVAARQGHDVRLLPLFVRWFGWCTLGWVGAWLLGTMFAG